MIPGWPFSWPRPQPSLRLFLERAADEAAGAMLELDEPADVRTTTCITCAVEIPAGTFYCWTDKPIERLLFMPTQRRPS